MHLCDPRWTARVMEAGEESGVDGGAKLAGGPRFGVERIRGMRRLGDGSTRCGRRQGSSTGGAMDNRSESGRDVDEGTLDQMAVESVDREAYLEGCSVVTLRTGVHVMDKEWTRRKDTRSSKRRGDWYNREYSQDSRVVGKVGGDATRESTLKPAVRARRSSQVPALLAQDHVFGSRPHPRLRHL
jgi:hypothetical protein